jgi:N-methylhydantoinase A
VRPVWFGDGWVDTPVYDGAHLGPGASVDGPALVEEAFTVVVVAPGWTAALDAAGTYDLRRRP